MTSGSLEYIVNGNSAGLPVANLEVANVPMIVGVIWGATDITAVDPPRERALGEWTAMDNSVHEQATIIYWPETPPYVPEQPAAAQGGGGGGGYLTQ